VLRLDYHEIRHHHFRIKYTELNEIYIFNTLRSLAFSLIVIFIPIYLLVLGYSIQVVFSYYIFFYIVKAVTEFFSIYLIRFFGPKHIIAAAVPFMLVHFFMLQTLGKYNWPLFLVAFFGAVAIGLYWQSYHYDFSRSKSKKKAGRDVSRSYFFIYLTAIAAPFIGGYLSDNFSIVITFWVVIFLLLLGSLALFKTKEKYIKKRKIDLKRIKIKEIKRDMISYAGVGWEVGASMIVWPLFIYLILGNYQSVGAVTSISTLGALATVYLIGKKSDKSPGNKLKYIKYGSLFKSLIYLLKIFVVTSIGVYLINIIRSTVGAIFSVGWDSEYYLHADEQSRSEYIYIMETAVDLSRAFMFLSLLIVSFFFSLETVLIIGFIFGSFGAIISGVMPLAKCELGLNKNNLKLMPRPQRRSTSA